MREAPKLNNDCFSMPQGVDWTPVDDALTMLKDRLKTIVKTETIPVELSDGRILAGPVKARRSNPPFTNSAVDGYAFKGALSAGQHCFSLAVGRSAAGTSFIGTVQDSEALRILTGAALPKGTDTVVLEEDVLVDGNSLYINGPLRKDSNVRQLSLIHI